MPEPRPEIVCLNGSYLPANEAFISALAEAATLGVGLFETMRARRGKVFRLPAHAARLQRSAAALTIACPLDADQVARIVAEVAHANGLDDARVRLTLLARDHGRSDILFTAKPLSPSEVEPPPPRCIILDPGSAPPAAVARHKTTNRLAYTLARQAALVAGADEGLLVNARGEVTEATSRNLFIVRDGVLLTPPVECGLLPGITRSVVLEIAHRDGIPFKQRPLPCEEVRSADECFITSAIVGILRVRAIDGRELNPLAPGPLTSRLMTSYRALTARELAL